MQYNKSIPPRLLFLLCCLILISALSSAQQFTTIKSNQGIEILEKGQKVLFYQVLPKSVNGKYERAGYVHPLYDLNGKILTDDMPPDHPYHRGIFWAWHQLILNDQSLGDGWVGENISWKPVKVKVKNKKGNLVLQSEMLWTAKGVQSNPMPIIREETEITVFKATPKYRILDFYIQLFALKDQLKIGGSDDEKGYGGFCLRLKLPKDLSFVSENKEVIPQETAVLAGPWMNFTGSFAGDSFPKSGVVAFGYPPDSGTQHPWILRKVTSMQNIPYPGRAPILLSRKGLKLRYRIVVHNADLSNAEIEELYKQYYKN